MFYYVSKPKKGYNFHKKVMLQIKKSHQLQGDFVPLTRGFAPAAGPL